MLNLLSLKQTIKHCVIKTLHIVYKYNDKNIFSILEFNKILIIRLDEIGDVVMTTPFIRELRKNYPNAKITLIVKPQTYNLVELCPYVDKILTFKRYQGRFGFFVNILKAYSFTKKFLQKEKFDLVIIPRWDTDNYGASYLAYFSQAKCRVAYSEKVSPVKARENKGFDKFFTDVIKETKHLHEVERNLDVIRFLGGKISSANIEAYFEDKNKVSISQNSKNLQFVITTSTSSVDKEWNIKNYIEIINRLKNKFNIDITLIGNGERAEIQAKKLEENCNIQNNLVNKTTLRESQLILKKADIYLGADTGPTHLAATVGIKGLALFARRYTPDNYGYNCPERFGPWQSAIEVLCPLDNKSGINGILPDTVYNKLEQLCLDIINEKDKGIGGVELHSELELWLDSHDKVLATKVINRNGINIVFCPTAGSKHREWDINKYCEVLNLLNKKFDFNVIVLGDVKNTSEALKKLKESFKGTIIDLVGKTMLRQTAALMMNADIFLGGDTGPMHIAAACKIEGVVISCHPKTGNVNHGNSPKRFGPWKSPLIVLQPENGLDDCSDGCNKTYAHCINQITVEAVYDKIEKILNKKILEKNGGNR